MSSYACDQRSSENSGVSRWEALIEDSGIKKLRKRSRLLISDPDVAGVNQHSTRSTPSTAASAFFNFLVPLFVSMIRTLKMNAGGVFEGINQPAQRAKQVISFGLDCLRSTEELNAELGESLQIGVIRVNGVNLAESDWGNQHLKSSDLQLIWFSRWSITVCQERSTSPGQLTN
jgi:hypothetical protein